MKQKLVTIIVAIYKSESFLEKLINSIINQTYKNLEIILVDDGSPDKSGVICDEYKKKDDRIKVIHKKNGGTCEARNYGLKEAHGEYISIIDGDDWLEPDYIEYLMHIINSTGAEMAMTDNIFTTRDRKQIINDKIETITPEEATLRIIYPIIPIGPWSKIYSKKIIDDNNISFSVPWSGEGLYFISTIAQCCTKVGVGHRKIYNYRLNNSESGLTHYNVEIGTNALWNIKNIKNNLKIKTNATINACNWHIWKNYNFVLKLIIGTNIKDNKKLFMKCIYNIKKMMPSVLIKSRLPFKRKIKIIIISIFPVLYAKHVIKKEQKGLKKDKMK